MSIPTNEDTQQPVLATTDESVKPARKRAAKKATVAKKVPAKKAAKNAPKEKLDLEFPQNELSPEPVVPKKKAVRAKKAVVEAVPAETSGADHFPAETQPANEARRIGRVPGGGPTTPREVPPASPDVSTSPPQNSGNHGAPIPQQSGQENPQNRDGQPRESRSKRRREKRKRRNEQRVGQQPAAPRTAPSNDSRPSPPSPNERRPEPALSGPMIEVDGMLELTPKGFGFLRVSERRFDQARDDVFVTSEIIRKYHLRLCHWVRGLYQIGPRGPQLVEVTDINGMTPQEASKLPHFDELKAINPSKRISFETKSERFTTRVVDIMAPVGRGQRGLIVSPPRSGKTTLLLHMAEAIREKYDESIHLMVLLVDERPEEVTEFRRALPGAEIYASSNDEVARNHCRIAELAIERAKRLVEAGKDVFLLMDSITRLARAYNHTMGSNRGRGTGSGGITIGALEVPRRLFAAARNTRGGGSLTIMATALIQTNSRADEAIFMEFKGTGNMELVLDRKIAENYIYPAVDIFKSGTRREELLLADHTLHKVHLIRRGLSGHRPVEAMERLLFFLKKFPNNPQMLLEIKG